MRLHHSALCLARLILAREWESGESVSEREKITIFEFCFWGVRKAFGLIRGLLYQKLSGEGGFPCEEEGEQKQIWEGEAATDLWARREGEKGRERGVSSSEAGAVWWKGSFGRKKKWMGPSCIKEIEQENQFSTWLSIVDGREGSIIVQYSHTYGIERAIWKCWCALPIHKKISFSLSEEKKSHQELCVFWYSN